MPRQGSRVADWFNSEEEFLMELEAAEGKVKTDFDEGFVSDTRARFDKYGMDAFMSERQMEVFDKIRNR